MRRTNQTLTLVLLALMGIVWSGCETRMGTLVPNEPPNTRISAGPPEGDDTSFNINLFWFGWDDDGFVDFFEIAWESPEEGNWQGPIFANDSLFTVEASEFCCVDPLPDQGTPTDSVYEQFHTFYVRAVDNTGARDPVPAARSFNAKTVAPYTRIIAGPRNNGQWGTRVRFGWEGTDEDGVVDSYRYALLQTDDYEAEFGDGVDIIADSVLAWVDTLTFFPNPAGGYFEDSLVWRPTDVDTVLFEAVQSTVGGQRIIFAVRSIDNAGAEEQVLNQVDNLRFFRVARLLDGPRIGLISNIAGTWSSGQPIETRQVFAGQGLRFRWRATPGSSETAVAGFSYAIDDTTDWSPFSLTSEEWPEQIEGEDEILWFPEVGLHSFFLRAIDQAQFIRTLAARIDVFSGPRFKAPADRFVLVVLDTSGSRLEGVWPADYDRIELGLVGDWFGDYDVQVHETSGAVEPQLSVLDFASSVFWILSADQAGTESSVLENYHAEGPNVLPSYIASGGNLFLCGIQPLNTVRYFENENGERDYQQQNPVRFFLTLDSDDDPALVPHWFATRLGIREVATTIGNTVADGFAGDRIRLARSQVTTGSNPYPDLEFDPLAWPNGPVQRGFGYYDRGIVVDTTIAEVIYTRDDTNQAVGVRALSPNGPGVNGNVVYLGLHPYFVFRPQFKELVGAVMTDFGEFPRENNP